MKIPAICWSCFCKTAAIKVVCPVDGTHAVDLAQRQSFDLFLLDNWMPNFTGVELTRAIRQFNQTTPILFYSGAAFESDQKEALDAGAQGYLIKPAGIAELLDSVQKPIANSKNALITH